MLTDVLLAFLPQCRVKTGQPLKLPGKALGPVLFSTFGPQEHRCWQTIRRHGLLIGTSLNSPRAGASTRIGQKSELPERTASCRSDAFVRRGLTGFACPLAQSWIGVQSEEGRALLLERIRQLDAVALSLAEHNDCDAARNDQENTGEGERVRQVAQMTSPATTAQSAKL